MTIAGIGALTWATQGWRVWTAESARRAAVLENPRPLPNATLHDSRNRTFHFNETEKLTLVDLIFTQCPTVCLAMGAQFRRIQDELIKADMADDVNLISITFDPEHDKQLQLASYLSRFGAIDPYWRAARFDSDDDLTQLLHDLGVIVIPEPTLGYVHNVAFYLIEHGRVIAIFDIEEEAEILEKLKSHVEAT